MNLRPARAGDLPAIMAIEVDVFPDSAWTVDQMRDELSRDTRWYTVAEDSDALIGYLVSFGLASSRSEETPPGYTYYVTVNWDKLRQVATTANIDFDAALAAAS